MKNKGPLVFVTSALTFLFVLAAGGPPPINRVADLADKNTYQWPSTQVSTLALGTGAVARTLDDVLAETVSVKNFDAKADCRQFSDAAMTSGSAVLTSATAAFVASDVGKTVPVAGANSADANTNLITTVASYQSPTQVTLSAACTTTVINARAAIGTDNTAAIQNSFNRLKAVRGGRWVFPPGNYLWTGVPFLSSATDFSLIGHGAKLVCTRDDLPPLRPNFWSRFTIEGLSVSHACKKARSAGGDGIRLTACTDYFIKGVFVSDVTCMGISNYAACTRGTITGCTVVNTLADGIHVTGASKDITVQGNHCDNPGDDLFACVAYTGISAQNERIAFVGNTGGNNPLGRGISATGGKGVVVSGNAIYNTGYAGVFVSQDAGHNTLGSEDVVVSGNTITGANTTTSVNHAAIDVRGGDPTRPVKNVQVVNNIIRGWRYRAVNVGDATAGTSLVSVKNNQFIGPGTADQPAINVQFTDHCKVTDNEIYYANKEAITEGNNTGLLDFSRNTIYYPNQGGNAASAIIMGTANGRTVNNSLFTDPAHPLTKPFDVFQGSGSMAWDNVVNGTPTRTQYRSPGQASGNLLEFRDPTGGTLSAVSYEGRFACANGANTFFEKFLGGAGQTFAVCRAPAATSGVTSQSGGVISMETARWTGSASTTETATLQPVRRSSTAGDFRWQASRPIGMLNVPTYADNAAALAGGLVTGDLYKTSGGVIMITQ